MMVTLSEGAGGSGGAAAPVDPGSSTSVRGWGTSGADGVATVAEAEGPVTFPAAAGAAGAGHSTSVHDSKLTSLRTQPATHGLNHDSCWSTRGPK
eukprot:27708-Chlamydomonas_euryale.AAC.3